MTLAIGLTGGIGSGKSTVCRMFTDQGIPTLDLDNVGRKLLFHDSQLKQEISQIFGSDIINSSGDIDRKALALKAFYDEHHTHQLNRIMHPNILKHQKQWLSKQSAPFAIIEASVLIESGYEQSMDVLIIIFSYKVLRKKRVLSREKQDLTMFESIIDRQCNDKKRAQLAHYTIRNNSDLQSLKRQQQIIYKQLKQHAGMISGSA